MTAKSVSSYAIENDAVFEFYLFAEPTAKYNIVLDLYVEQKCKGPYPKAMQSVGWLFCPINALPAQVEINRASKTGPAVRFPLLKGSARMLLDSSRA